MARCGLCVSSPSVDDASNPANDRKPNTTPRNSPDGPIPGCGLNTLQVKCEPPGASPFSSRTNTTTVTMRISVTVHTSTTSSTLVPPRAGSAASTSASASAMPTTSIGAQAGWFFQMPRESSSPAPKMPAAAAVTTA